MMKIPKFIFLRDEPLDAESKSYFDFYHSAIEPALVSILKSQSAPHTIGLFGSWGTGKSTIVNMLKTDKKFKTPVFVFDAWKYQEDALRRTFLIKLVEFLELESKIKFEDNFLHDMYVSTEERREATVDETKEKNKFLSWVSRNVLLVVSIVLIIITVASVLLSQYYSFAAIISDALKYLSSISIIAAIMQPLLEKIIGKIGDIILQDSKSVNASMLNITHKEKLNSPEEFEKKFKDILKKLGNKKLVVVFDNIDRVQGDVAVSMISTIKTFMEPNNRSRVVFIIPCDPEAIDGQIKQFYFRDGDDVSGYQSSEYLRKVFNLILWLPNYISTDLEEYTSKCLSSTGEISNVLNTPDVVLVINTAFSNNPREIIQFVNNLTALTLAAYNSSVVDLITANIAYLAKVQVIKQKFPSGYKRLQGSWNNPESIYESEPKSSQEIALREFMLATSRITVDDAEPFLYFKDPLATRNLNDSPSLLMALSTGDSELLIERIQEEANNRSVFKFTLDVMNKYKSIPQTLITIYNAQFKGVYDIVPDGEKGYYFDTLAKLVDSQLWSRFHELDTTMTFQLIRESKLDPSLANALKTRYLNSLKYLDGGGNPPKQVLREILKNIIDNKDVFTKQQLMSVRQNVEDNSLINDSSLDLFVDKPLQEEFVSESTLINFMNSMNADNVQGRMDIISSYGEYILSHTLIPDLLDAFTTGLEAVYQQSNDPKQVVPYAKAIGKMIKIDRQEVQESAFQPLLTRIYTTFSNALNASGDESVRSNILIGLWWLYGTIPPYDQSIINAVATQMSSLGSGGLKLFFDYWDENTRENIFNQVKPTFFERIRTEPEILDYLYQKLRPGTRQQMFSNYIQNRAHPDTSVVDFISRNFMGNEEAITDAIEENLRVNGSLDDAYIQLILKLRSNSPRASKPSAMNVIESLLKREDITNNQIGMNMLENEKFLTLEDKKATAENLLTYLEARASQVDTVHTAQLRFIVSNLVGNDYRERIVKCLIDSLYFAVDTKVIDEIFMLLSTMKVRYKSYHASIIDLYQKLPNLPDNEIKQLIIKKLPSLRSPRQTKLEREFWQQVQS